MIDRRRFVSLASASALTPALGAPALAQSAWPNKPVRLIVPFAPGGGTDGVARILTTRLSEMWGQQFVIENRGGAGSNLGIETVARSDPDGYTVLIASLPFAINRFIYGSVNYDSLTDFAPVTLICHFPNLMIVPNSSPVKSVQEFIDYAKARPGKITYGTSGTGTSTHLSAELFKRMAGIEMTHVPYRGVAPALNDLMPGRLDVMFNTLGGTLQQARAGQVRGLAVTSAERFPTAAEFPTVAATVPGFAVSAWYALFVPAKTPDPVVRKIHADTMSVLAEPAVRQRLEAMGLGIVGSTPEELGRHLRTETDLWGPVIKAAGITSGG
jgi:tripartite-type tricarboxylate transporter receptor subunit TctC